LENLTFGRKSLIKQVRLIGMKTNILDRQALADLETALPEHIEDVWEHAHSPEFHRVLAQKTEALAQQIIEIGEESYHYLQETATSEQETFEHFTINYQWSEQAKLFLLLWRDVCFEHSRARLLSQCGAVGQEQLDQLFEASKKALQKASEELFELGAELRQSRVGRSQQERQLAAWRLQKNPWPVYREQLEEVGRQGLELRSLFLDLEKTLDHFQHIEKKIGQSIAHYEKDLEGILERVEKAIRYISEQTLEAEDPRPGRVAPFLEDMEKRLHDMKRSQDFTNQLDEEAQRLSGKQRVPVSVQLGYIQFKEVDFKKTVLQYLESEVLPSLYEIWEIAGRIQGEEKNVLLNIRNRALLLSNEIKEGRNPDSEQLDLTPPLRSFSEKTKKVQQEIQQLKDLIANRMQKEYRFSILFHPTRPFLPIPLQYSLNNFMIDQDVVLGRTRQWLSGKLELFQQLRKRVEIEDTLSFSEKTVRYIQNRQVFPDNSHYTSIFMTKGYVGESFWVGRTVQMQHAENLVQNWNQGFRGSATLTGRRLSGRTFFGELVSNRFFPDRTIRVRPDQDLVLPGRRFPIGYDLEEALQMIRKYCLNNRPFVWIDDLELWSDISIPFGKNVKTLLKFIDDHSNRMFFLVSMTNWARDRINQFHQVDQVFQTDLNLDRMPPNEIGEALLIRHGATHKPLIDARGQETLPGRFRKMVGKVLSVADGNIGDALHLWAASIQKAEEEQVRFHFRSHYPLPDAFDADSLLILSTILLEKRTNEYRLSKLFGPAFARSYNNTLQRLLNIGLLERQLNGWLEINPLAVNDVAKVLYRRKYLIPQT
jgi:hypothetical protein